jgi:hypothetical protein
MRKKHAAPTLGLFRCARCARTPLSAHNGRSLRGSQAKKKKNKEILRSGWGGYRAQECARAPAVEGARRPNAADPPEAAKKRAWSGGQRDDKPPEDPREWKEKGLGEKGGARDLRAACCCRTNVKQKKQVEGP